MLSCVGRPGAFVVPVPLISKFAIDKDEKKMNTRKHCTPGNTQDQVGNGKAAEGRKGQGMANKALERGQADTMHTLLAIQNGRLGRLLQQLQARCACGMWPCVCVLLQVCARIRVRR